MILLASRAHQSHATIIDLGSCSIGDGSLTVMAGPCSVESEEQIHTIAKSVKHSGAKLLRGGAFKPRTSPYDFQGLGIEALQYLRDAARANDLKTVTEVLTPSDVPTIAEYADILQVGARNMQNTPLLKALGECQKPILLKRGMSATYKELLLSAEYILASGNRQVILCERGIRTFENHTRNTLDITAIPVLKDLSHLPVIIDPSHGTGRRELVSPLCRAAVAAGADGLLIEVHHSPDEALSDARQTISTQSFHTLMTALKPIAHLNLHSDHPVTQETDQEHPLEAASRGHQ